MKNNTISTPFQNFQSPKINTKFNIIINLYQTIQKTLNHSIQQNSTYYHSIPQTTAHITLIITI